VLVPDWFWYICIFAFGCCIGSFLNVVICRLPRNKSLLNPPSTCPACGNLIQYYDNIPLFSWLILRARCRYCKSPISPRYFIIELLTALIFTGCFHFYFRTDLRAGMPSFLQGGWLIYLVSIVLLGGFIAASAIDLELWVIPVSICWLVTAVGLLASALGPYLIDPDVIRGHFLLPSTSDLLLSEITVASLAAGAAVGTAISIVLLVTGVIKRSYESASGEHIESDQPAEPLQTGEESAEPQFNHCLEMGREIVFLLPIVICCAASYWILGKTEPIRAWWLDFSQIPAIAGLLGGLWSYFVGCGIVWAVRILGTIAFRKEAMGLGDVHLMGAAGAVIGPVGVIVAFFIAPFFGLAWAAVQMFFKKTRQIPYGPFLSLAVVVVMILHDRIYYVVAKMIYH
jgi:leader peptidase (prepilin peptidase)/N-methyltransferase